MNLEEREKRLENGEMEEAERVKKELVESHFDNTPAYAEAVKWWKLAAEKDFTPNGLTRESLDKIRTAAERGDVASQTYLAGCYARGILVPLDYDEALKWFRRAAILGDEKAKEAVRRLEKMCEDSAKHRKRDLAH